MGKSDGNVEVDGVGRMDTSSAWPVPSSLSSFPCAETFESSDVHHSPDGSFCINANLRRLTGSVDVSFSTRVNKLSVSSDIGAMHWETWSSNVRVRLQKRSCWAPGVEERDRECEEMGKRCCMAVYRIISNV